MLTQDPKASQDSSRHQRAQEKIRFLIRSPELGILRRLNRGVETGCQKQQAS